MNQTQATMMIQSIKEESLLQTGWLRPEAPTHSQCQPQKEACAQGHCYGKAPRSKGSL